MESFYFGEGRRLFGLYHPAVGASRDCGLVLCNPFGQEAIRAHRVYLVLARRLARRGLDVLRFDLYGCGDSLGDDGAGHPSRWLDDLSTAVTELRDGSGVSRIGLLGVRLGASLAALVGADRTDIRDAVLWDPVVDGSSYLQELEATHRDWLRGSFARERPRPGAPGESMGFRVGEAVRSELERLDLGTLPRRPAERLLWIDSGERADGAPLAAALAGLGADVSHRHLPTGPVWRKAKADDEFDSGPVPTGIVDEIEQWLTASAS
jgi:pimeloyl-ACP methyl ester carboxylesterase